MFRRPHATLHAGVVNNQGQSNGLQLIYYSGIEYRSGALLADEEDERAVDDEFRRVSEDFQKSVSQRRRCCGCTFLVGGYHCLLSQV